MIEFSITEMLLLVVAAVGWAGYFHEKEQHRLARRFIDALLHDEKLRDALVREVQEFEERVKRST